MTILRPLIVGAIIGFVIMLIAPGLSTLQIGGIIFSTLFINGLADVFA